MAEAEFEHTRGQQGFQVRPYSSSILQYLPTNGSWCPLKGKAVV